jgi:hypothetical protein
MFECPDHPDAIAWAKLVIIKSLESIAPEWGLTDVPFKAEADVGRRWNIYRTGVEYEYTGDTEEWWTPSDDALRGIRIGLQNARLLEAKHRGVSPEPLEVYDGRECVDEHEGDTDWAESEGATVYGYAPSTEPDRELERV